MDALSQALAGVHMTGAIFFRMECTAPWGFSVPDVNRAAHLLAPGTERLVNYHFVTGGEALVRLAGADDMSVVPGDVVVLSRGDAHTVCGGSPRVVVDGGEVLRGALRGRPRTIRMGGGGAKTTIVCGFFGCERHADTLFLAGLPPVFKVNLRRGPAGAWIESSVGQMVDEAESDRPGSSAVLSKIAEALFIESLRGYAEELPEGRYGWLAAARDPVVGAALSLLHADPVRSWSVSDLAGQVGASRSVLGERFARFLGQSPMHYLANWRMQLAARLLETTERSVLEVANDVGYESESSFNRAFNRALGVPPAAYRRRRRASGPGR